MKRKPIVPLWAGAAALAVTAMIPPALPDFAAVAQAKGDQKCSPAGYVLEYRVYPSLGVREWANTYVRCDPRNGGGSSDDDRPARWSSRDDENGGTSGGRPEDGDEKCGPDGYIMKYDWSDYLQKGSWQGTLRRCTR